jgi:hypothetical protein
MIGCYDDVSNGLVLALVVLCVSRHTGRFLDGYKDRVQSMKLGMYGLSYVAISWFVVSAPSPLSLISVPLSELPPSSVRLAPRPAKTDPIVGNGRFESTLAFSNWWVMIVFGL